jgi:hypothetical protein
MGRASQARGLLGYVGFRCSEIHQRHTMEVDMERLQRTMQWLAIRKEAGLKLDPETAEVEWCYAQTLDPYGGRPRPAGAMSANRPRILPPLSCKRCVGQFS